MVDSFVGYTGNAQIVELDVNDTNVSGYAAYEDGVLVRAVFINLYAWVEGATGTRPSVQIGFDFMDPASAPLQAYAQRLNITYATDTQNLTWAGQSYEETPDVSPTGELVLERVYPLEGFTLWATEAVMITFY